MNIDRHGNNRLASSEYGLAWLPPHFASLVRDAGAVLGASTECYCDAAATQRGAVLGASTACNCDAAATRRGAALGTSTDSYYDAAAAVLLGETLRKAQQHTATSTLLLPAEGRRACT